MKKEKTSLEKSHSKWSNFKLTLIAFIASIMFSIFWISIKLFITDNSNLYLLCVGISIILMIISLNQFKNFKR